MKLFSALLLTALAASTHLIATPSSKAEKNDKFKRSANPIQNRYIVIFNDDLDSLQTDPVNAAKILMAGYAGTIDRVFTDALKGYSVEMNRGEAERLSRDPRVKYVEEDAIVEPAQSTQPNAPWGISRIDQRGWAYPLDSNYDYNATGNGVNVYVIDTGIYLAHPDFEGRAFNAVNTSKDNTRIEECNGHGTHVAGIIGGKTFGVAKGVQLYSVRVFPCWGGTAVSNVISGVDWVTRRGVKPAVANMSLGTSFSQSLNDAVAALIDSGVSVVTAAGNSNSDACGYSPSNLAAAITVGATDNRDYKSTASNWGSCVDVFAPGVGIESSWNQPDIPAFIMSGTSTAAPHVSGIAALYLSSNQLATPGQVANAIVQEGTPGVITSAGSNSPNLLAYSLIAYQPGNDTCGGIRFVGTVDSSGSSQFHSSAAGFSGRSGKYVGAMSSANNIAAQLRLERKQGRGWTQVATSTGAGSNESVLYDGKNGTYRWVVQSVSGSGSYSLCSVTP